MNVYGGDKGEGGIWSIDAGKVPTRFLAVKPKEKGIHTTLHVISNTGQEISFFVEEVTGVDAQFDAEVDANPDSASTPESDVKWVPADEATSCKTTRRKPLARPRPDIKESPGRDRRGREKSSG